VSRGDAGDDISRAPVDYLEDDINRFSHQILALLGVETALNLLGTGKSRRQKKEGEDQGRANSEHPIHLLEPKE
jgi:hypothetical protein